MTVCVCVRERERERRKTESTRARATKRSLKECHDQKKQDPAKTKFSYAELKAREAEVESQVYFFLKK